MLDKGHLLQAAVEQTGLFDFGGVKMIVAHHKSAHPNWVETTGHNMGALCWRWIGAQRYPPVAARVVKFSELRTAAP